MKLELKRVVSTCFTSLVEQYGLRQQEEETEGETYSIKYVSHCFVIRLETYRHEFYVTLYKADVSEKEIGLFNLLAYLIHPPSTAPVAEYFHNEENIVERYRKQLTHVATAIENNFEAISLFFNSVNYESNVADVEQFVIARYPGLFKRW
jgi:hypothetical protein